MSKEFNLGKLKLTLEVNKELYVSGFALHLDIIDQLSNDELDKIIQTLDDGKYEAYFPINDINMKKVIIVDSEEHLNNNESEINKRNLRKDSAESPDCPKKGLEDKI